VFGPSSNPHDESRAGFCRLCATQVSSAAATFLHLIYAVRCSAVDCYIVANIIDVGWRPIPVIRECPSKRSFKAKYAESVSDDWYAQRMDQPSFYRAVSESVFTLKKMIANTLSQRQLLRPGSSSDGCTVAERLSGDFLVDGESLLQSLVQADGGHANLMGCFVKGYPEQNAKNAEKLIGLSQPDTATGRFLLYTCPECGDIGCDAYSARIMRANGYYTWSEFAYENGYEDARRIVGIGPFSFDDNAYKKAIKCASTL